MNLVRALLSNMPMKTIANKIIIFSVTLLLAACNSGIKFNSGITSGLDCSQSQAGCEDPTDPGANLETASENFAQKAKSAKVDILFVVDNSSSMEEEQARLGSRFTSFISGLQSVDWQMAFTTTDVSNGRYGLRGSFLNLSGVNSKQILTPTEANVDRVFKNTIQRPETLNCSDCPSADEQPLRASILAMQKSSGVNAKFFRADADLAIVMLSDEDEMSTGPIGSTSAQEVVDAFHSIWGNRKKLAVYGIIIQPGDKSCLEKELNESFGTAAYATRVADLSYITGGITGSICDTDYSASLETISDRVRQLVDYFELKNIPLVGSVQVQLDPVQNISWKVDGNKLIFSQPPKDGTKIHVSYKYQK